MTDRETKLLDLLRRAQEFVGTETQEEGFLPRAHMKTWPPPTEAAELREEAARLDRCDALILEIRAALLEQGE